MNREFTAAEAERHNSLTERAWRLAKSQMIIDGKEPTQPPGWFARRKLQEAIRCFEQALQINPQGWSSMWGLGKIYQRLGDHQAALNWFARAHEINPAQPDVAREAGLAALDSGQTALALKFCSAAVANQPENAGLLANLALAHLFNGDDKDAVECALRSVQMAPADEMSRTAREFVRDVAEGRRARPKRLVEVFPY